MKTYVISGATGMIGKAIIAELLHGENRVIALVRPDSPAAARLPRHMQLTVLPLSLADYADYTPTETADVFLHLAWGKTIGEERENMDLQLQNVQYSLDAVRLAARFGCRKFVGAGSQAEYGPVSEPLRSDTPTDPQSGYGIAKYTASKMTRTLCRQLGLSHNWARFLSVYGEGDTPLSLMSYLFRSFAADESPELTPCEQIWDYLYVEDAARALIAIADHGVDGKVYPVGCGKGRPLADYVRILRDAAAPGTPIRFGAKPYYPHQPMFLVADITELTADTGFAPTVSFEEGVRRVLGVQNEE